LQRLRIAFLTKNFDAKAGGAERYAVALAEQLSERHEVHVFSQSVGVVLPGVSYHPVRWAVRRPRWINQLLFAYATWRMTRQGYDVVHSHENVWHGRVQTLHVLPMRYTLSREKSGLKRLWKLLGMVSSPRLLAHLGLERSRFQNDGRVYVAVSETLRTIVAQTYTGSEHAMHVIPPGIAGVAGAASTQERLAARAALGLPLQGRCLLLVGNDLRKKGLGCVIRALAVLADPSAFVAVVGHVGQRAVWDGMARDLGLGSQLHFLGVREDVSLAYIAADILVHPTLEDTYAMVVLEAMSHALPVIASSAAYCGISAELTHDVNALLLQDPHDANALAGAVRRLQESPNLQQRLGANGVEFATQRTWGHVAQRHERLYADLRGIAA
jgi:UDP-glucose:(heptosyl)LPS alpha-1,3-glucosyltransferase